MAADNPGWGYTRIREALAKLGHEIARNTVKRILQEHGIDGFLRDATHLIHDRDPLFTIKFAEILKSSGVTPIKLPPRSPNLNAYAERFVRSIKNECLSRVVVLGERHLRLLVREYVEHYHRERNH
ncbi:MAG: transposase InsO family protein [Pseudoalteromonas tetraodonis]|jgi:transposase InsO family protein